MTLSAATSHGLSATAITLFATGGSLQTVGTILVVWPDAAVFAQAVRRKGLEVAAAIKRRTERLVRRLLRRRPPAHVVTGGIAGTLGLSGSASVSTSVPASASVEEKVEFLLRRDQETQARLSKVESESSELRDELGRRITETREELIERIASEIQRAFDTHRRIRLAGAGCLIAGSILATVASLV